MSSPTQAVILAGGLGTRLRPLTYDIPKPMVPLGDRPFLERQIALLKARGIDEVLLLIGYLGEMIEDHFGDGSKFGMPISYVKEAAPMGTGGALMGAWESLRDDFLILYGDSWLDIDYLKLRRTLLEGPFSAVLVAYDNKEHTDVKNNLALGEDGRVILYQKDGVDPRLSHVEAGVTALRKSALEAMPRDQAFGLEGTLFPGLIKDGRLGSLSTQTRFYDIGTPSRLAELRRLL